MITFNIAAITDGQSSLEADVLPEELGLGDNIEFNKTIHVVHQINKVGPEVFIKSTLQTTLNLQCDVCLDSFLYNVTDSVNVILTTDSNLAEGEDDVYLVSDVTSEIDITESIRQSLLLDIPFKKKCSSACKGLCPTCGANLNKGPCTCKNETIDPRWEALKKVKFD